LYLIDRIPWPTFNRSNSRGRPYVYSQTVIMKCFIVRIWFRLDSNNALHEFLEINYPYNNKIMKACGLTQISDRRTFDRRLRTISTDIKERIVVITNHFIHEVMIDPYTLLQ
jgi:hypothetical protein